MEKKYKHKRLNWVAEWDRVHDSYVAQGPTSQWYLPMEIVENDSEWVEQVSKVYEIVSFKNEQNKRVYSKDPIGFYSSDEALVSISEEEALQHPQIYSIHSVRRMSDNSVWILGDKVVAYNGYHTITKFEIIDKEKLIASEYNEDGQIFGDYIQNLRHYQQPHKEPCTTIVIGDSSYSVSAETAKKVKVWCMGEQILDSKEYAEPEQRPVILRTENGKDITDGNTEVYYVAPDWATHWAKAGHVHNYDNDLKWFSAIEDRQEYIEYYKPMLSQKEVIEDVIAKALTLPYQQEVLETIKCALDSYIIEKMNPLK